MNNRHRAAICGFPIAFASMAGCIGTNRDAPTCIMDAERRDDLLNKFGDGEQIHSYEILADWWNNSEDHPQIGRFASIGTCRNGKFKYLAERKKFSGNYFYFRASDNAFVGMRHWTDMIEFFCPNGRHWPRVRYYGEHVKARTIE